ncbi:MAG: hypothetical protein LAN62_12495 [Acidobacteriia bacterium]|nr:hypothetical protein [Terriglobia bacterium]
MRRLALALILLASAPAGGLAQASYFDDLPAPPYLELCAPCFNSASEFFLFPHEVPAFLPELEGPLESPSPPPDPWENLSQLRQGQNIRILRANSQKLDGRFLGLSADALAVEVNGKVMTMARADVVMVSLKPPSKAKRILLGVLGGALVGFSIWAEADRHARNCWEDSYYCEREDGLSSRSAVIATAVGAGIGGMVEGFLNADELVIYFNQRNTTAPQPPPAQDPPPDR